MSMITRRRLDERLFGPAPVSTKKTKGRPRWTGPRLPTLAQRLLAPETQWQSLVIPDWHGSGERRAEH